MTTFPDGFNKFHLDACDSTNDYLKENIARLEPDFPIMVSTDVQSSGRGRENRSWSSPENLGIYATFGFFLTEKRRLGLLPLAAGVAVGSMLEDWTGKNFALKWPNDILANGEKIAGILCETIVKADKVLCLAGIGINVNQRRDDFPEELRERAGSLRLLTGREWPLAEGRERLAASMAAWLQRLETGRPDAILSRARSLSRSFLGREIQFRQQGRTLRGTFCGLAADGGLLLRVAGREEKIFYNGEITG